MTALTPGCDPDMSTTGAPFGAPGTGRPRLRSGAVLVGVVALAVLLVGAGAPGGVTVPVVVVGGLCALALVARAARVVQRAASAAAASVARVAPASGPVPSTTP
jgi:H+/Cl- antiporter ClcA